MRVTKAVELKNYNKIIVRMNLEKELVLHITYTISFLARNKNFFQVIDYFSVKKKRFKMFLRFI